MKLPWKKATAPVYSLPVCAHTTLSRRDGRAASAPPCASASPPFFLSQHSSAPQQNFVCSSGFFYNISEHADGERRGALVGLKVPSDASQQILADATLRFVRALAVCRRHAPKSCQK